MIALMWKCFLRNRKLFWLCGIGTFIPLLLLIPFLVLAAQSADTYQLLFSIYLSALIPIALATFLIVAFQFSSEMFGEEKEFLFCAKCHGQLRVMSSALIALLLMWAIFFVPIMMALFIFAKVAALLPAEIINAMSVSVLRLGGTTPVAILMGFFLGRVTKKATAYNLIRAADAYVKF